MAEARPQSGSKRKWDEIWSEIIARPKGLELPSGVLVDAPSASLYKPLPTEKHIRILIMQPASNLEDSIDCDLEVVLCTAESDYKALSYSWAMENGDCSRNRVISVQSMDVAITQNLCEGLRRIRQKRDIVRIWIDALCINQDDVPERNSQVAQMHQIYKNAQETLVWLGEDPLGNGFPEEDNDGVLRAMNRVGRMREPHEVRSFFSGAEDCICLHQGDDHCICGGSLGPPGTAYQEELWSDMCATVPGLERCIRTVLETLHSFFQARYWTRRWIVQEYASKTKSLLWGRCQRAPLNHENLLLLGRMQTPLKKYIPSAALSRFINLTYYMARNNSHLIDYLSTAHEMHCSDDRDVLYSLISLSNPYQLVVDYNCTTNELYREFSSRAIADGHWVFILGNSGYDASRRATADSSKPEIEHSSASASDVDLPTWAADLRHLKYPNLIEDAPIWLTVPQFVEDRLVIHAFFMAVISHLRNDREWVANTGNDYLQHGDASRLVTNFTVREYKQREVFIEPGDLLFLPDVDHGLPDWEIIKIRAKILVVRPRSPLARHTRLVVEVVGVMDGPLRIREALAYRSEEGRIELEIM